MVASCLLGLIIIACDYGEVVSNGTAALIRECSRRFVRHPAVNATASRVNPQNVLKPEVLSEAYIHYLHLRQRRRRHTEQWGRTRSSHENVSEFKLKFPHWNMMQGLGRCLSYRHRHERPASLADLCTRTACSDVVVVCQVDIEHELTFYWDECSRLHGEVVLREQ